MTRLDKLIARICARPPEARFADVRRLLEAFGWVLSREEGSHAHFVKREEQLIITVPKSGGRKVKRAYLDMICKRLGLDEDHEHGDEHPDA